MNVKLTFASTGLLNDLMSEKMEYDMYMTTPA